MKVKDLIELLKEYDEDAEVVMQEDSEGNGYRRVRGADEDSEFEAEYGDIYFLNSYGNVDAMAEDMDMDVSWLLDSLKDVVVIY